jgi:SAM-dependent methyltransferase
LVNKILSKLFRPERGWDPVPFDYVKTYGEAEWANFDSSSVDVIENKIGPLIDKDVIDLGAGPGQYTLEFARRGAKVTWFDISKRYQEYFCEKFLNIEIRHPIEFHIGYLEESLALQKTFDFVFNRICWYYCMNDFDFASVLYNLLKEGGWAYCIVNHLGIISNHETRMTDKFKIFLNEHFRIKVGHPHPSKERVQSALAKRPFRRIEYEITSDNLYIWLQR